MLLLVGGKSFIAREFIERSDRPLRAVSHMEVTDADVWSDVDCVVNFAFSPLLHTQTYCPDEDIDLRLAEVARDRGCHYVMISSRRVYNREAQWGATESSLAMGADVYGANKVKIERNLAGLLGERLTILRPGNVFGFEIEVGRSRFGAFLLNQLASTGDIHLTINPFTRRDVIPVDYFCAVVDAVVDRRPSGIFNVGVALPVEVGRIALWLLQGFGSGRLIVDNMADAEEFSLDSRRLESMLSMSCGVDRLTEFTRSLGVRLKDVLSAQRG